MITSSFLTSQTVLTHLNQTVTLRGWLHQKKKVGNFLFLTLRDFFGVVNLVIPKEKDSLFKLAQTLLKESVLAVTGLVKLKKMKSKECEIWLSDLKIINSALLPPFLIADKTDGQEKIRLQYRYLDLRRPVMQTKMVIRSQIYQIIRQFFNQNYHFLEVETPILAAPTMEGAQNFTIQSASKTTSNFALPQSPQIYKQLLMASGLPGYFQIARCFRDEDLRNDRQPEFSQLDLEVNFATATTITTLVEKLLQTIYSNHFNSSKTLSFPKIDYYQAWEKYGSDSPDLRYQLFLADYHQLLSKEEKKTVSFRGLTFSETLSSQDWIKLQKEIAKIGNHKLSYYFATSSLPKTNLLPWQITALQPTLTGTNWIGLQGERATVNLILGKVRFFLATKFQLFDQADFQFCWVVNPPLFSYSPQKKRYLANHHPFCQPQSLKAFAKDWQTARGDAYDLVLNGIEIGSGSSRIYDWKLQKKIFTLLQITPQKIEEEFGYLLKAMQFGYPYHAGFALGLDRLLMILTGSESIRDVIAFPKTSKMTCLLTSNFSKKA